MGRTMKLRKAKSEKYSARVKSGNKKNVNKRKEIKNKLMSNLKTLKENYKSAGIQLDPNSNNLIVKPKKSFDPKIEEKIKNEDVEEVSMEMLASLIKSNEYSKSKTTSNKLKPDEILVIKEILKKYNIDDIEKIQKDKKLNTLLWNENQIEKKIKLFQSQNTI